MAEEYVFEFARALAADDPYAFRFAPQQYLMRTSGGGFETAEFPWDQGLLADLNALRLPGCDPAIVQRVGDTLRRFLQPLGFGAKEEGLLSASRAGRPVVVSVRSAAAELYALPWELLTLKTTGQHLGGLPNIILRYEWPETHTTAESPSPQREGGRILFGWSAAAGAVPASEHAAAISAACEAGFLPFDAETDVIAHLSCGRLLAALEAGRQEGRTIAVLHLLCHGGAVGSTFGLVLDGDDTGQSVVVDAARLRQLLAPFADMVRLVVLSACDSGNSGALGNHLGSVAQALHRAGFAQVIASRYPLSVSASIRLTETLYHQLLAETRPVEQALGAVRERLARDPSHLDWASVQLLGRKEDGDEGRPVTFRPFRGLLSFQPQHRRFFFGRSREIDEIIAALSALVTAGRPRFLVVAGASGSGKSSLVLAGAVPRLLQAAEGACPLAVMQPGSDPQRALDAALRAARGQLESAPVLLVVDQFEEIFTHLSDPRQRQDFVRKLWRLATNAATPTRVIATLRVDFIGECGGVLLDDQGRRLDSVAYDQAHRVFVAQLGPEQLRSAIESPAQRVGIALEAGLTSRMLDAVGAEPGALPLLAHTLDLLWLRRQGRTLTQAGYDALGQLAGALSQHAEALLGRLSEDEQRTAHRLLVRLVHVGEGGVHAARQRVLIERLRPRSAESASRFDKVLAALVDARLLVRSGEEESQSIELAHEALVRSWPRLIEWIQKDRELLARLAKLEALLVQWREHKALLVGDQLRFVEQLAHDYKDDVPEEAWPLLRRSQRNQLQIRWFKRLGVMTAVVTTIIFGVLYFVEQRAHNRAELARNEMLRLLSRTNQRPTVPEMLRTLARLRLELEERPDLALEAVRQAREVAPESPELLADHAEYLLADGRLDEVDAIAQQAFPLQSSTDLRLRVALVAWTAARLRQDKTAREVWSARMKSSYAELASGGALRGMFGTSEIQLKHIKPFWKTAPMPDIIAVYSLLRTPKSARLERELASLLGQS